MSRNVSNVSVDLRSLALHGARVRLAELRDEVVRLEAFLRASGGRLEGKPVNGRTPGPGADAPAWTPAGWTRTPVAKRAPKPKPKWKPTAEQRARSARRMRRLWKEKRAVMLRGALKGSRRGRRKVQERIKGRRKPAAPPPQSATVEAPAAP